MNSGHGRNRRGWSQQDALLLVGVLVAGYFGAQYFIVHNEPDQPSEQ